MPVDVKVADLLGGDEKIILAVTINSQDETALHLNKGISDHLSGEQVFGLQQTILILVASVLEGIQRSKGNAGKAYLN